MKLRLVPLTVTAAFLLPFVLAWWLNFGPSPWRPDAAHNRGFLIEPPVPVEEPGVRFLVPGPADDGLVPDPFRGRWSLVYAGDSGCPEACQAALVNMRQSWLALGKDARRVRRWFLVTDGKLPAPAVLDEHPGLTVIAPSLASSGASSGPSSGTLGAALAAARESVAAGEAAGDEWAPDEWAPDEWAPDEWVWLLDPRGFVILSYGPSATATDMLKDMQRLLKYSAQDR